MGHMRLILSVCPYVVLIAGFIALFHIMSFCGLKKLIRLNGLFFGSNRVRRS